MRAITYPTIRAARLCPPCGIDYIASMKVPFTGAIDCDLHPAPPAVQELLPFLDDYWREQVVSRHIHRMPFQLTSYPPRSPLSVRPDWRDDGVAPAGSLDTLRRHALDPFGLRFAICNVLHGAFALHNDDMAAALCSAVNDWVAKELLDAEPRLRASILVPQSPHAASAEIERLAPDKRFVQVLLPVMGEVLLGRRSWWPVYAAAEKHRLSIGIHAGGTFYHAPSGAGWPSYHVEDYVANSGAFESQLVSLLSEGVFQQFPSLTVVLLESGFTWLPTLMWRTSKTWRGVRTEIPWIDQPPAEIIRERVRVTLQPVDAPAGDTDKLARTLPHIGCDRMLLFSTDYPHWQFDGADVLPDGLPEDVLRKLAIDNPLDTYPRLRDDAAEAGAGARSREAVP
jgi:predicted TIM-barrel fold metal-dependent hydrolase